MVKAVKGKKQYPEPVCGALILNPEGKVFLMRSPKWHDRWVIPGGHIELGERIEDALMREVKEETGLTIRDIRFIRVGECVYDDEFWKKKHFVFVNYSCRTDSTVVRLSEEATEYRWVTFDEAQGLPLGKYTKETIGIYLSQENSGSD